MNARVDCDVEIGGWRIRALADGFFRLDGGAMWGVVPAVIWRKLTPPDEDNTIRLALRPFLLERDGFKVVLELGMGARWSDKHERIYKREREPSLAASLAARGIDPREVTHVLATHTHWDHFGGAVVERAGQLEPLFPNARHFTPASEIRAALEPGPVRAASYRADDVRPLVQAGLLEGFEGVRELLPGVRAHELGGHSDGVSLITIGDERSSDCALFWSDVVPTTHHLQPAYIMAYDQDVLKSYTVRAEWIARAAERGWVGLFYHDESIAAGRIERGPKRYELVGLA